MCWHAHHNLNALHKQHVVEAENGEPSIVSFKASEPEDARLWIDAVAGVPATALSSVAEHLGLGQDVLVSRAVEAAKRLRDFLMQSRD